MGLTAQSVSRAVDRAKRRMETLERDLNEADARLGDGDTGGMLARVLDRLAAVPTKPGDELGATFAALARAAASATGSSLGTLLATGLLAVSRHTAGETEIEWSRVGPLLETACESMMKRGRAALGDKTVLDAINAAARASRGADDAAEVARRAAEGAAAELERLRNEPCRIGRARMFAERSVGLDDPGMLAFVRLTQALAAAASDSADTTS